MLDINDGRFEKVYAKAIEEFHSYSTESLLDFVKRNEFPYRSSEDYLAAYDLTLVAFALERRSDTAQYLTPETRKHLDDITNKAKHSVTDALEFHDGRGYTEKGSSKKKYDFLTASIGSSNAYDHMILSYVYPEYYGPEAAPEGYKKAIQIMADFWGDLLSGKQEDLLFDRWKSGGSDSQDFFIEITQAVFAAGHKQNYTEKQISDFKEALKNHLLLTGLSDVSMRYHPDTSLKVAGYESNIRMDMLTFPSDTSTNYVTYPSSPMDEPYADYFVVKIYNGRSGNPVSIPVKSDEMEVGPVKPVRRNSAKVGGLSAKAAKDQPPPP